MILIMILQAICTKHMFPVTRSQAKLQKIAIPFLFKSCLTASIPKQKPSLLQDPPAVLACKRSPALPPVDLGKTSLKKHGCG